MVEDLSPASDGAGYAQAAPTSAGKYAQIWRRSPQRVHRVLPGQVIVAAPDEQTLTLGGLAAAIWIVLNRPGYATELVDRIADGGAGAIADIADVVEALELMKGSGVLATTTSSRIPATDRAHS